MLKKILFPITVVVLSPAAAQVGAWAGIALFGVVMDLLCALHGQPMIPQTEIVRAMRAVTFL